MDIWIDNRFFKVNNNYTIFQFCAKIGINLPCFCYHERLSIAGNCRICLVEANNSLVVSCATMLLDQMKVFTKTKRVKKAREGVMEFLLVNHPLDCPICDQGGECDLQDILLTYGSDRGRFYEIKKRSVTNLNCCGPFIKTVMTRCIHCTRCVRFVNEISSIYDFGVIGRGSNMEIGTYILNFINDELLANIIDLCPVGALISMPSSFQNRNWEIKYIQNIDILDSVATSINIGIATNNVVRILPHIEEFYDEWITNKTRFVYDSFNIQRLYYPKLKLYLKFISISWKLSLYIYIYLLFNNINNYISSYCGSFISLELIFTLKFFFNYIGSSNIFYYEVYDFCVDNRYSYLLNNTIKNLYNCTDLILIGCNIRLESPIINSTIRKNYLNNQNLKAYSIGLALNFQNYPIINLGSSSLYLKKYLLGNTIANKYLLFNTYYNLSNFFNSHLFSINIILGSSIFCRYDSNFIINSIYFFFNKLKLKKTSLNVIFRQLGKISISEIGISNKININLLKKAYNNINSLNLYIGLDHTNLDLNKKNINIFLGSFFLSNFFDNINLIFCSNIYIENIFSYINLEGRFRYTSKALTASKLIFADYQIIYSIFILSKYLFVYNFSIIKNYNKINTYFTKYYNLIINFTYNIFNYINYYNLNIINKNYFDIFFINFNNKISNSIISKIIYNYYNNDMFSINSKVLSQMSLKIKYKVYN